MTTTKLLILAGLVSVVLLLALAPIPQDMRYHEFADQRTFLTIPNFWNVLSNLLFLFIGILGFYNLRGAHKLIPSVLFGSMILLTFASGYYHLDPGNYSLAIDRLAMTLLISSFFAIIIDRVYAPGIGLKVILGYSVLGVLSVIYWYYTEQSGLGDLRAYAFVQFYPFLAVLVLLLRNELDASQRKLLQMIFLFYTLAKLCEHFDVQIYEALGSVSGHTLKHFFVAIVLSFMYKFTKPTKQCF